MKKIKYLIVALLLLIPITGKAAINCSTPGSVESGETFGVTYYGSIGGEYPIWFGKLASEGNVSYSSGDLTIAGEETNDFSRTIYYTAGDPGSASFYAYDVDVASYSESFDSSNTCYVEIVSATRPNDGFNSESSYSYDDDDYGNELVDTNPNLSANNFLKSLEAEGIKLSPIFSKDKLDYTAVVDGSIEKVIIKAETEDATSTIEGTGEKTLNEGINKYEIKVIAENGESKSYTVTITRKEKDPIEVTINKKKYTVAKKEIGLKIPEGFVKTKVVIDKQEVVAYSNSFTGYLIVALVDEDGNASWYIYSEKNGTYEKYSELMSDGLRLIIMTPKDSEIPYKYKPISFEIDGVTVDGYALEYNSQFRLIYALNMKTGKKSFYLYDIEEKTFQRFYDKQVNIYRDLVKKMEIAGIALAGVIVLLVIIVIAQAIVKRKIKKFVSNPTKEDKNEIELQQIIKEEEAMKQEEIKEEETKEIKKKKSKVKEEPKEEPKVEEFTKTVKIELEEEYQDQDPISKKEMKKRLKEEKKELKKARKEFLD